MGNHTYISPYSPNTKEDRLNMLTAIGVNSAEDLFEDIPKNYRNPILNLPSPQSELELKKGMESLSLQNIQPGNYASFLGAGAYHHYIPAVVRQIASRGEYMTSYTPYQPEVAQGTLQTTYEFQSLVCQLTGMEIANAGMYDGATAMAEAVLMAARVTKRNRIAVMTSVSPIYQQVLKTYVQASELEIDLVTNQGLELDERTACLVIQNPNFFGYMENLSYLSNEAHSHGALLVVSADPISLGMFKAPGDFDADIVVAEGQSLGVPTSFGGPYVGLFSCKKKYLRQMPGRIVGETVDSRGNPGYVLTIQTREQHIRRERATSNICTSVALMALMATSYMAALGKRGMRHIAELCYHKSHYASSLISQIPNYSLPIKGTFFREFVVACPLSPHETNQRLLDYGIIGGFDVSSSVPNGMLFCVTELNSRQEIELLTKALAQIGAS